ncbi:MAG: bifunctional methylenetetrahydrofolate dehydrogenase/methenyltetrahydrofolate cyclohydrolase FolD [Oscillospiraceae bacterium]|nr:bifunctional methylenetetrahydrofolate dehydrogenase/methenyltetrahydrofolate cyclohydrolase FolD [Oscillospiraceae bacterium]
MAKIIDGKKVAERVKADVKQETSKLKERGISVTLAVVIVGDDPASHVYVKNKRKDCEDVGFISIEHALPADIEQDELSALIERLNADTLVDGILVQLPLPPHIDESVIINSISPDKDVDAFHPQNVGHMMIGDIGDFAFLPCTPAGVMELIKETGVEIQGKNCVVIGRSNIVGKPMAMLLLHEHGTVTICHSRTQNLAQICRGADILVAAVGRAGFVTADMLKESAVVIDVGMNKNAEGKLCGDVDYQGCFDKAGYITPVPGGVGPMTRAMLMKNTLTAAKKKELLT